jgi:ppGpp synthetase/RelA/SpoT-type nucleotidyltranferase
MNFDDYEKKREPLYAQFAEIVKFVLETAIADGTSVPRPQSIQCRAKSAASLKPKLHSRGLLESEFIEKEIKDLAGVRLIFYTNTDVDRFLNSRLIPEHFEVDWKETKIHHPTSENAHQRYQAIHYTVFLNAQRIALPDYAKFKGLRCEIQIQTILNHAWAETSHDILYKAPESKGFGTKAFQSIEKRMMRVMDEYLLPAGYELQKVQHDFERLMQGKALFDRGTLETLAKCDNNNDRHQILSTIREYFIPNYDDVQGIYPELCRALVDAVRAARTSEPKPIESAFGTLSGNTAERVTTLAINLLQDLRYVDIDRTFQSLADIFRD